MSKLFHFVINSEMQEKIVNYSKLLGKSTSKTIEEIIEKSIAIIRSRHYFDMEEKNEYPKVNWSKRIVVKIKDSDYRELKLIHANLNVFSIAKIVRYMIDSFFLIMKIQGEKNIDKYFSELLVKIKKKVKNKIIQKKQLQEKSAVITLRFTREFNLYSVKLE